MIGFTLSKINLLILAISLFAIIGFFTFGIQKNFLHDEASNVIEQNYQQFLNIVNSSLSCSQKIISLPNHLTYFGSNRFFYILTIRKVVEENKPPILVLSISDRKTGKDILSAKLLEIPEITVGSSNIKLFYTDNAGNFSEAESIVVDPQGFPPTNALIVVKEEFVDSVNFYVVSCNGQSASKECEANLILLRDKIYCERIIGKNYLVSPCFEFDSGVSC